MELAALTLLGSLSLTAPAVPAPRPAPGACTPRLEHSAPWLGEPLEFRLEGAAPGARVVLLQCPSPGSAPAQIGRIGLDPERTVAWSSGLVDEDGRWEFRIEVPPDATLAEVGCRFQALVREPSGATTRSGAVQLRFVGPRLYTLCFGKGRVLTPGPWRSALDVHSVVRGERIATIPLGPWQSGACGGPLEDWRPVFSADLARGAALTGCEHVVVFDNDTFDAIAQLDVDNASNRLISSADGRSAYVLESPGGGAASRVRTLDLASASFVATLELPPTCEPVWSAHPTTGLAFVKDFDPVSRQALVRRVDLANGRVLDALRLGVVPGSELVWLDVQGHWLYVGLKSPPAFVAFDLDRPGSSQPFNGFSIYKPKRPFLVPAAGRLFMAGFNTVGPSADRIFVAPVDHPARLVQDSNAPGIIPFQYGAAVARHDDAWVLTTPGNTDYPALLWHLDAKSLTWRLAPQPAYWLHPVPIDLLAARDGLVDVLLLPHSGLSSPYASFDPAVDVVDPDSGAILERWPLSWGAKAAHVLQADP